MRSVIPAIMLGLSFMLGSCGSGGNASNEGAVAAAPPVLHAGDWEIVTSMDKPETEQAPGTPAHSGEVEQQAPATQDESGADQPHVTHICISEAEALAPTAAVLLRGHGAANCSPKEFRMADNKIIGELKCGASHEGGETSSAIRLSGIYRAERYLLMIESSTADAIMTGSVVGRRTGDCKKG